MLPVDPRTATPLGKLLIFARFLSHPDSFSCLGFFPRDLAERSCRPPHLAQPAAELPRPSATAPDTQVYFLPTDHALPVTEPGVLLLPKTIAVVLNGWRWTTGRRQAQTSFSRPDPRPRASVRRPACLEGHPGSRKPIVSASVDLRKVSRRTLRIEHGGCPGSSLPWDHGRSTALRGRSGLFFSPL